MPSSTTEKRTPRRAARSDSGADAEGGGIDSERPGTKGGDGEEEHDGKRQAKAPWHFKFIAAGSVVYLGWRLYQGISWLVHHI